MQDFEGRCTTPVADIPDDVRDKNCPWELGYGCMGVSAWDQGGLRTVEECASKRSAVRAKCWRRLEATAHADAS